jgi:putative membrane protein
MCLVADDTEPREPDYRFIFANERTFLAWQRTSLGLLARRSP